MKAANEISGVDFVSLEHSKSRDYHLKFFGLGFLIGFMMFYGGYVFGNVKNQGAVSGVSGKDFVATDSGCSICDGEMCCYNTPGCCWFRAHKINKTNYPAQCVQGQRKGINKRGFHLYCNKTE